MEKKKFNAVDAIIILFAVIIIAAVAFIVRQFINSGDGEMKRIVVEITEQKESFCNILTKNDVAYDGVENVRLGTVVDFEVKPSEIDSISSLDGTIKHTNIPERYDILLTLEVPQETEAPVGKQLWIETSLYKCDGYILEVDDGGKAAEER